MKQFKDIIIYEEDAVSLNKNQIYQLTPTIRKHTIGCIKNADFLTIAQNETINKNVKWFESLEDPTKGATK